MVGSSTALLRLVTKVQFFPGAQLNKEGKKMSAKKKPARKSKASTAVKATLGKQVTRPSHKKQRPKKHVEARLPRLGEVPKGITAPEEPKTEPAVTTSVTISLELPPGQTEKTTQHFIDVANTHLKDMVDNKMGSIKKREEMHNIQHLYELYPAKTPRNNPASRFRQAMKFDIDPIAQDKVKAYKKPETGSPAEGLDKYVERSKVASEIVEKMVANNLVKFADGPNLHNDLMKFEPRALQEYAKTIEQTIGFADELKRHGVVTINAPVEEVAVNAPVVIPVSVKISWYDRVLTFIRGK